MSAVPPPIERLPRRDETCQVPRPLGDGLFEVDATWGEVQPMRLAPGIETVGELEVIEHLEHGRPLVDTRLGHFHRDGTIPGARGIPHEQILEHLDELDPSVATVFFCNGPQCPATPDAIRRLLDHGYPPPAIRYYRGGIHTWMTLGYPVVPPAA
jgi:rhodanese-related sulfurtransferase